MFNVHYNVHLKFDINGNLTAGNFYAFSRHRGPGPNFV